MDTKWWYAVGGQRVGPVPLGDLVGRLRTGEIPFDTLVWTDGMAEWQRVTAVEAIRPQVRMALDARAGRARSDPPAPPPAAAAPPPPPLASLPASPPASPYAPPTAPVVRGEEIALARPYAGFWKRFAAFLIDNLVIAVPLFIVAFIVGFFEGLGGGTGKVAEGIANLLGFLGSWVYFALMESSAKQATLGKMALGIMVTDLDGNRISFGRATGRYFAKIVSGVILLIGYFMAGWTQRKQGLHDMMAGTLVVDGRADVDS
jgi:uncharacterized RDD family membrane protein YckC